MEKEREDMVAPDEPAPNKLTDGEQRAVYRYLKGGAEESALATYFNTTVSDIRNAKARGQQYKWK